MTLSTVTERSVLETQGIEDILDTLLAISQKMLLKAQESAWQELAELQLERDEMLRYIFSQEQVLDTLSFPPQYLEHLLLLNEEIVTLCQQERDRFSQGVKELQRGSHACDIYRGYIF